MEKQKKAKQNFVQTAALQLITAQPLWVNLSPPPFPNEQLNSLIQQTSPRLSLTSMLQQKLEQEISAENMRNKYRKGLSHNIYWLQVKGFGYFYSH